MVDGQLQPRHLFEDMQLKNPKSSSTKQTRRLADTSLQRQQQQQQQCNNWLYVQWKSRNQPLFSQEIIT